MRNHLRQFTPYARGLYRGPLWNRQGVMQGPIGLRHNAFPFLICFTQDFPRSNAVHTLRWSVYSPPCTPFSIREGPVCHIRPRDPTPESMVQSCFLIQVVWDDMPQAGITRLSPFVPRRCRQFVTSIIDRVAHHGLLHRGECHNNYWFNPCQAIFWQFSQLYSKNSNTVLLPCNKHNGYINPVTDTYYSSPTICKHYSRILTTIYQHVHDKGSGNHQVYMLQLSCICYNHEKNWKMQE